MTSRRVLFLLLAIVAAAAAVLSFSALRDLALVCGFAVELAWLLPVVVDAGAAAGSLVWLGGAVAELPRRFARVLALALLALSVAANALGHGLEAFGLAPAWWVVVIVSAVAPAVLGAVVHLAVLVGRPTPSAPDFDESDHADEPIGYQLTAHADEAGLLDENGLSHQWDDALRSDEPAASSPSLDRAAVLIAAGAGRRRLARELSITEYEARRLLRRARTPDLLTAAPLTADPFTSGPGVAVPEQFPHDPAASSGPVLNGVRP